LSNPGVLQLQLLNGVDQNSEVFASEFLVPIDPFWGIQQNTVLAVRIFISGERTFIAFRSFGLPIHALFFNPSSLFSFFYLQSLSFIHSFIARCPRGNDSQSLNCNLVLPNEFKSKVADNLPKRQKRSYVKKPVPVGVTSVSAQGQDYLESLETGILFVSFTDLDELREGLLELLLNMESLSGRSFGF
jgi:hypothetical protein